MVKILKELVDDHRNMARLLDLIGRELKTFQRGGRPDYELVGGILNYCLHYPDLCHHPKEELISDTLLARDPTAAKVIGNLRQEHGKLSSLIWQFLTVAKNALEDETLPRQWFLDVANDCLSFYRNHIQMEEVLLFPAARKCLIQADWDSLDRTVVKVNDPLFGAGTRVKFRDISHYAHGGIMVPLPMISRMNSALKVLPGKGFRDKETNEIQFADRPLFQGQQRSQDP